MRKVILLLCLILACAPALCAQKPIAVDATDIEKHILVKPKLEFPEVMCAAHVIGTVVLDVDINEQGKVFKDLSCYRHGRGRLVFEW